MGQANCCRGRGDTSPAAGTQQESGAPRAHLGLLGRKASWCPQLLSTRVSRRSPELLLSDRVWVTQQHRRTKERHLLLFPDAIAVASLKCRSTFRWKHRVCLSQLWVVSGEDEAASRWEEEMEQEEEEEEEVFSLSRQNTIILVWPTGLCAVTFWSRELKEHWLQAMLSQGAQGPEVTRLPSLGFLMEAISFSRPEVTAETVRQLILADAEVKQYPVWMPPGIEGGLGHSAEPHGRELLDGAVERQVECQKGDFLDKSLPPLATGTAMDGDVAAREEVSELDMQVEPLLQELIDKTVEQACLEITVEEELAYRWEQQCMYLKRYNAELVERLEDQQKRYREEKDCCQYQKMQGQQKQVDATEKTAAQTFVQCHLADLTPSVCTRLHESRDFSEPAEADLEAEFLPCWVMEV